MGANCPLYILGLRSSCADRWDGDLVGTTGGQVQNGKSSKTGDVENSINQLFFGVFLTLDGGASQCPENAV